MFPNTNWLQPVGLKKDIHGSNDSAINLPFVSQETRAIKYIIVIDAGSTGIRIHVYHFLAVNESVQSLHNKTFKSVNQPITKFVGNKSGMKTEVFDKLLNIAMDAIQQSFRSGTRVSLKATAGLRFINENSQNDILENVHFILKM